MIAFGTSSILVALGVGLDTALRYKLSQRPCLSTGIAFGDYEPFLVLHSSLIKKLFYHVRLVSDVCELILDDYVGGYKLLWIRSVLF